MSKLVAAVIASYLAGSLPTALLLVQWVKRIDVRTIGSGNVGATNALRAAGPWAGLAVFLIDVAKGWLVTVALAPWLLPGMSSAARLGCGLAAVLGHSFPLWLTFRGGKGVATMIGVLVGTMPRVALVCLAVWVACFVMWRYVSVASLAAAVALPIAQLATSQTVSELLLGSALALLIIVRHRGNIERLMHGQERRAGGTSPTSRSR